MNAELKAKWLAALRSGDYQQGREYLHRGDTFCCLGVLCEVAMVPREPHANDGEVWMYLFEDGLVATSLPQGALRTALVEHVYELTKRNDDDKMTFADIADYVDAHIPTE